MEQHLFRVSKSAIISVVMYLSLVYMGFATSVSLTVCLIPLVLGSLGIMVEFAYIIAALTFVAACASSIAPDLHGKVDEMMKFMKTDMQKPDTTAKKAK